MDDKLVTIAKENQASALILQSFLKSKGIEAYLHNETLVQALIAEDVEVLIKESDLPKAISILTKHKESKHLEKVGNPRKILVPIDFSTPSINAARFAVYLASRYGSEVKLLHVFNSPLVDMIPFTDAASIQIDIDFNYNILRNNAKEKLTNFYEELKQFALQMKFENVKIGYSLVEGYAAYGIIETSHLYKPGLIVMGTKGDGYRSTELVGSVAAEVSEETKIPLLTIPEAAVAKGVNDVKNILYTTNFDVCDFKAIRKLLSITSLFKINLHCLHVSTESDLTLQQAKMDTLKNYFKEISPKLKVECSFIKGDNVVDAFKNFIRENNIDLIALTTHKRSIISKILNPSVSKKMLYQSDIPVLLFHE